MDVPDINKNDNQLVLSGIVEKSKGFKTSICLAGRNIRCIKSTNVGALFLSFRQFFAGSSALKIDPYKWTKIVDANSNVCYWVETETLSKRFLRSKYVNNIESDVIKSPEQNKQFHEALKLQLEILSYARTRGVKPFLLRSYALKLEEGQVIFYSSTPQSSRNDLRFDAGAEKGEALSKIKEFIDILVNLGSDNLQVIKKEMNLQRKKYPNEIKSEYDNVVKIDEGWKIEGAPFSVVIDKASFSEPDQVKNNCKMISAIMWHFLDKGFDREFSPHNIAHNYIDFQLQGSSLLMRKSVDQFVDVIQDKKLAEKSNEVLKQFNDVINPMLHERDKITFSYLGKKVSVVMPNLDDDFSTKLKKSMEMAIDIADTELKLSKTIPEENTWFKAELIDKEYGQYKVQYHYESGLIKKTLYKFEFPTLEHVKEHIQSFDLKSLKIDAGNLKEFPGMTWSIPIDIRNSKQIQMAFQTKNEVIDRVMDNLRLGKIFEGVITFIWDEKSESFEIVYPKEEVEFTGELDLDQLEIPDQKSQKIPILKFNEGVDVVDELEFARSSSGCIAVYNDEGVERPVAVWRDPVTYERKAIQLGRSLEECQKTLEQLQLYLTNLTENIQQQRISEREKSGALKCDLTKTSQIADVELPEVKEENKNDYKKLLDLHVQVFGSTETRGYKAIQLMVDMIENKKNITGLKPEEKKRWYETLTALLNNTIPLMKEALELNEKGEINHEAKQKAELLFKELEEMTSHCAGRWVNVIGDLYAAYKGGPNLLTGQETPESFVMKVFDKAKSRVARNMQGSDQHNVHVYNWVVKCLKEKGILLENTFLQYDDIFDVYGKKKYKDSDVVFNNFKAQMSSALLIKSFISDLKDLRGLSGQFGNVEYNCMNDLRDLGQDEICKKEIENLNLLEMSGGIKEKLAFEAKDRALVRGGYLEEVVKDSNNKGPNVRLEISEKGAKLLMQKHGILTTK